MRNSLMCRWVLGFGIGLLLLLPNLAEAQRPSLGGLQVQINEMLSGDLDFQVVSFGDNCQFCIDPTLAGLIEKDPGGFRVFGDPNSPGTGAVVRFGPTDDCTIGVDPEGRGLLLRDRGCFIFENPLPGLPPIIRLGDPTVGGLVRFGPDCEIGINPNLPVPGLCFSDPFGFHFINPFGPPVIRLPGGILEFGDECRLRVDPTGVLTGMIEEDPAGLRLLGQGGQGCILTFGPTDLCRIRVAPEGPTGLIEEDVVGVRLLGIDGPTGRQGARVLFGPTDDCSLGIVPGLTGLVESDPGGLRLLGPGGRGCILTFGPTDLCRFRVDPTGQIPGFIEEDVVGLRMLGIVDRAGERQGARVLFGPTDDCSLGIVPGLTGLVEQDPGGLRLLGPNGTGCILTFGPTDDCRTFVNPTIPGMILTDRTRVAFDTPDVNVRDRVSFGSGLCSIGLDPGRLGLLVAEINGTFFESPQGAGEAFVDVDGTIQTIQLIETSSADMKENVRTIDNALDKVKNLRGVYFDWKKEVMKAKNGESISALGFIAEEVAEVVPEAVKFDETGKKAEGVQYANLVSLVVESVKEQQQQIEAQQKQIDDQQAQIDDQQQVIQELQAAVAELLAQQKR